MEKFKKALKHLFTPAIVLVLVAIMGIFSPAVSVAAALRLSPMAAGAEAAVNYTIENLPARTVTVDTQITSGDLPSVTNDGYVRLRHAGKEKVVNTDFTYSEVGQYEWRFYTKNDVLFDTYTVTVTDASYSISMPSDVVTVAPKGLNELKLPLPSSYVVNGKTMEVKDIVASTTNKNYATLTLVEKGNKNDAGTEYHLSAKVTLANDTLATSVTADNVIVDLTNSGTGTLKVTYLLSNENDKLLKALPLSDIEIKNVAQNEVTFANIPTAPSVSGLAYYSSVALTAPSADSAKVGNNSFKVEAQSAIVKVQAYLFSTEPSNWNSAANVITLTLNDDGTWSSSSNDYNASDLIEINGLSVKVKALGYYRFQFKTSTLFGYKLDNDFDNYDAIEQDGNKTYVKYWSDSVKIASDTVDPNFAWVADYTLTKDENQNVTGYTATVDGQSVNYDEDFYDYLNTYDKYLPMTDKPDSTTTKKVTVNYSQGLVLPAIFPHDNATSFANMTVKSFNIEQIQDANGKSVSSNYAYKGDSLTSTYFTYDMSKHLKVNFTETGVGSGTQLANEVTLKAEPGLYQVTVTVQEQQPKFLGDNSNSNSNYARTKTKYLYFYLASDSEFKCGTNDENSPVVDENNMLQVSDVYLWEGHTFDFPAPEFTDTHTPKDNLQIDYYLVSSNATTNKVVAKLDYVRGASRITVDLDHLVDENGNEVAFNSLTLTDTFYIYAVARNFNGMQANLKFTTTPTDSAVTDEKHFSTDLFKSASYGDKDAVAQYGYAWKRAGFKINAVSAVNTAATPIAVTIDGANTYKNNQVVHIENISTTWSAAVDGQMSAAVYLVKANNVLQPVVLKDGNTKDANVVSTWAFNRATYSVDDLYFTPSVSGEYILVVTAKEHSSNETYTSTTKITIGKSGETSVRPRSLSTTDTNSSASEQPDATISLGESLTLPEMDIEDREEHNLMYGTKSHILYEYDNDEKLTDTVEGDCVVTLQGISDPNCVTGNKFVPTKDGKYKFVYEFYLTGESTPFKTEPYIVQVNPSSSATTILMNEDYDGNKILNQVAAVVAGNGTATVGNGTKTFTYVLGADGTGTSDKPAYAITLDQFTMANYGAATDFVVDSASLFDYLEPIWDATNSKITGYMYPAIAIPMPNVVTDLVGSDEVEITVQKSGSSNYLVSSKKLNAGNSTNSASVIGQIGGYYVFRPEGTFNENCKNDYNADTYLQSAVKTSSTAGVYTVNYKTTSNTSVAYNVTFGDLENGEITWNEGFLTYNDGSKDVEITASSDELVIDKDSNGHRYVTIDMNKVYFTGNKDMEALIAKGPNTDGSTNGINPDKLATEYYWNKVSVTVTYEDGTFITSNTWSADENEVNAIKNHDNYTYKFDLNQGSGTYKVTITMSNSYTSSSVSSSLSFTLDAESTNKNVNLNTVWGIILIVLSVGLLAGVVFYFVKTARATRFVDAPREPKAKKVKKQDTKTVATPKDAEAPKKDAE